MITIAPGLTHCATASARTLATLPRADFIARWRSLVGEPPAAMLEDRSDMIRLLVQSAPIIDPAPVGTSGAWPSDAAGSSPASVECGRRLRT